MGIFGVHNGVQPQDSDCGTSLFYGTDKAKDRLMRKRVGLQYAVGGLFGGT
jgi:hypothetical protein